MKLLPGHPDLPVAVLRPGHKPPDASGDNQLTAAGINIPRRRKFICCFCGKKRPANWRKHRWGGVLVQIRGQKSHWCCPECKTEGWDVQEHAVLVAGQICKCEPPRKTFLDVTPEADKLSSFVGSVVRVTKSDFQISGQGAVPQRFSARTTLTGIHFPTNRHSGPVKLFFESSVVRAYRPFPRTGKEGSLWNSANRLQQEQAA
jgi:hypothetical protein